MFYFGVYAIVHSPNFRLLCINKLAGNSTPEHPRNSTKRSPSGISIRALSLQDFKVAPVLFTFLAFNFRFMIYTLNVEAKRGFEPLSIR